MIAEISFYVNLPVDFLHLALTLVVAAWAFGCLGDGPNMFMVISLVLWLAAIISGCYWIGNL